MFGHHQLILDRSLEKHMCQRSVVLHIYFLSMDNFDYNAFPPAYPGEFNFDDLEFDPNEVCAFMSLPFK
jgi:hypothetical protein